GGAPHRIRPVWGGGAGPGDGSPSGELGRGSAWLSDGAVLLPPEGGVQARSIRTRHRVPGDAVVRRLRRPPECAGVPGGARLSSRADRDLRGARRPERGPPPRRRAGHAHLPRDGVPVADPLPTAGAVLLLSRCAPDDEGSWVLGRRPPRNRRPLLPPEHTGARPAGHLFLRRPPPLRRRRHAGLQRGREAPRLR